MCARGAGLRGHAEQAGLAAVATDGPVVLLIGEATAVRHAAQLIPVAPAELVVSSRA